MEFVTVSLRIFNKFFSAFLIKLLLEIRRMHQVHAFDFKIKLGRLLFFRG